MLKTVARYAVARGLPGLVNLIALALFTRLLDEHEYGQYTLLFAGVSLVYAVFIQWVSQGVLRLASVYSQRRLEFLGTVLQLFRQLFAVAAAVLAVGIGFASGWNSPAVIVVAVALLLSQSWHELNLKLATADQVPARYGLLSGARAIVSIVFGGVAGWAGGGVTGVVLGVTVGGLVPGLWVYRTTWQPSAGSKVDSNIRGELIKYGVPLAGTFLLAYAISTADRFLLAAYLSPAAAGAYAPAYDLTAQAMGALLLVVNLAAYPLSIAAVESGDVNGRDQQLGKHATLLLGLAIPAAAGMAVLAPSVSHILGQRFAPTARELIPLLALAQLFAGLKAFYFDLSFQLGHATRLQFVTVAAGALVNIGLNMWLIPLLGLMGAAYATVGAYFVALVVSWLLGRSVLVLPLPTGALVRVTGATLAMCLVLLQVRSLTGRFALVGQVGLGAAAYFLVLLLFARGRPRRIFGE